MMKLSVIQAEYGDCLLLKFGSPSKPAHILIDGGPSGTYPKHLHLELEKIRQANGCLELMILSHVDNDHIIGLLEMLADMAKQRAAHKPDLVPVRAIWHNAFEQAEGRRAGLTARIDAGLGGVDGMTFSAANAVTFGIKEGSKLVTAARQLNIPLNPNIPGAVITTQSQPDPVIIGDLKLWVIGPTPENLAALKEKWLAWLETYEKRAPFADGVEAEKIDRSVPNLSSIMLLAQVGQRKILLTGDATSDDVLEGLRQRGFLDSKGRLKVDVIKLPHHGSVRNMRRAFFEQVTAKTYVISANGRDGNPDLATLIWLVTTAKSQRRKIKIVATNATETIDQLVEEYPPETYRYTLVIMNPGDHALEI
jgi:beta-lactamase superfamily II metal-dependent hydrolase